MTLRQKKLVGKLIYSNIPFYILNNTIYSLKQRRGSTRYLWNITPGSFNNSGFVFNLRRISDQEVLNYITDLEKIS